MSAQRRGSGAAQALGLGLIVFVFQCKLTFVFCIRTSFNHPFNYLLRGSFHLMRLSSLVPSIPADVVTCLESQGIRTDMDLLFATTTLDTYKRLPAGTATLEELIEYRSLAAKSGAAPGISGHELVLLEDMEEDNVIQLQTGVKALDDFFRGLAGRRLIELSGDGGSGKSVRHCQIWKAQASNNLIIHQTVALNLVLRHLALHTNDSALWVDTTCNFSADWANQLVKVTQALPSTLERLQISLAFDIETILGLLEDPTRLQAVGSSTLCHTIV